MRGSNELRLCHRAMMDAVEYWLNREMLQDAVTVVKVEEVHDHVFVIQIKAQTPALRRSISEFRIAGPEMCEVLAFWLNTALFREDVNAIAVSNVIELNRDNVFSVSFDNKALPQEG